MRRRVATVGRRLGGASLWLMLWLMLSAVSWAQEAATPADDDPATLLRLKAGYLYKFGAFVEWPPRTFATARSPVVIGVLDQDTLADELALIVGGRSVQGREIVVRRLHAGDRFDGVHVLYLGKELAAPAPSEPVLTVADERLPAAMGGVIRFVRVDGRLRFQVFMKRAQAAGLVLSARLLAVAQRVEAEAP